jgi:hypothetical protein
MDPWWISAAVVLGVVLVAGGYWWNGPGRLRRQAALLAKARRLFKYQREQLEARFLELAAASGKPRGLRWMDCDFDDEVAYARELRSGQLAALVGVTIRFEAIEGGPMEDVEAVHNLRAATAVFYFRRGRWHTEGRALFNLNPTEAIAHYRHEYEMVGHEPATPR